jgi:hypothetical protein
MTMPFERKWSVEHTEKFLIDLMDPKKTPRVPKYIRERARQCLRHYPSEYYMQEVSKLAPEIFGVLNNES